MVLRRLQGQHAEDPQLNATGAAQSRALAARLARGGPAAPDMAPPIMRGNLNAPDMAAGDMRGDPSAPGLAAPLGDLDAPDLASGGSNLPDNGTGDYRISAIYSSDLRRALETAEIATALLGVAVTPDASLRERHLGVMEVNHRIMQYTSVGCHSQPTFMFGTATWCREISFRGARGAV